jgi:predicted Zn finger-like uncharacterized protein
MDIKCERCSTEYDFDDAHLTEEGVTVKCSACGHLFKIRKKSFVLTEPVAQEAALADAGQGKNWMVRRKDGAILSFKELTTLQKWIVERKVSRDDEISKSGETWKRLGGIAELASFFQIVDQAMSATQSSMPAMSPPPPALPVGPQASYPPPPAPPVGPLASYPSQPALPAGPQASYPPPPALPVGPQASYPPPPVLPVGPQVSYPPGASPTGTLPLPAAVPGSYPPPVLPAGPSEPDSWNEGASLPADDDVVEKWKRRGRRKWFVILPLLLLAAGVVGFYLLQPALFMSLVHRALGQATEVPALARSHFQAGQEAFLRDSQSGYATAQKELESAIQEAKGRYPEAAALLATVHVTRADRLAERIRAGERKLQELEAREKELTPAIGKEPDGARQAQLALLPELQAQRAEVGKELERLRGEAQKLMDEARRLLDAVLEAEPNSFEGLVAKADHLRVRGAGRAQVELPLKEAAALRPDAPELRYVDGAAGLEDEAGLEQAAQKLGEAVELQQKAGRPDLVRARYALARALVLQKRPDDARLQLERVLQVSPEHEAAQALLASLAPPPPPPEPVAPAKPEPKPEPEPRPGPAEPQGFDAWMAQADALQQKGRTQKALEAYERALEARPGHVEALTGKGLCLLDLGSYPASIQAFQQALKANPAYGDAILGLGEAHKYKGDRAGAIKWYQRYLDVHPSGPEASVARSNLAELK